MCYFMRTLIEMLIFILFHKVSSKLFNNQHFCSPHSVVLQFILSFQLCMNKFAYKICRVGAINKGSVGLAETQHFFFGLKYLDHCNW